MIPVIIVSGIEDTAGVIDCIEAGADDYLHKPFNPVLLHARLRAGLQRKGWHDREQDFLHELERNHRFIRNTFGRYLSDEIVDELLESPEGLNLGGTTTGATILMADIRNFTTICEQQQPERVVSLLNNYLGVMSEIIMNHHGTVDEFIGDGILAIFGAPVNRDDDASRAIACAIDMQSAIADINARNVALQLPEISIGIGLNTGIVVAGNIGSERRSKYGVVGHPVNLTARIESYTQGGQILASEATVHSSGAGSRHWTQFQRATPKAWRSGLTCWKLLRSVHRTTEGCEKPRRRLTGKTMPRILLVEDNEMNRDLLSRRLTRKGYEIILAEDGEEAIRRVREDHPDLVLMDMNLPVKHGWTASRELKADPLTAAVPVIALTAHAMSGDRERALDAGCDDYETKPIELPRLLKRIESLLEKRQPS